MSRKILSLVMPVYNEKNTVSKIIEKILRLDIVKELIIVDDGSTDGTRELLKNTRFDDRVKVLFQDRNMGKGSALRTGFKEASADIVVTQDADLEYDPVDLVEMVKPIEEGMADVVYGSRLSGGRPQRVYMFWHRIGNDFLTFMTNLLYNTTLTDMETGYKMFRKRVIDGITIRSNGFTVEPELTAKILKNKKLRIYEMPISYYGRTYAEGKKISWRDGLTALWAILRYRFTD
ncbi:MAG: glycosyltransferase family 2 protein [Candidatus Omnitrophica bacterium]|nr:glycosyltransferase family 2 protein [Candidatus Omnitrophota bacterium]